jgi:hypothetical protein
MVPVLEISIIVTVPLIFPGPSAAAAARSTSAASARATPTTGSARAPATGPVTIVSAAAKFRTRFETQGIEELCRPVVHVSVEVRPARRAQRIFTDKPLRSWTVIARPRKVQPRAIVLASVNCCPLALAAPLTVVAPNGSYV